MNCKQNVPFYCTWKDCYKSFTRKSGLRRHVRVHTGERPHSCTAKDCNKSFIQKSALTVHSRTHTGEKRYLCQHQSCRKAFADSSSLARHRRTHTRDWPYISQEQNCKQISSHKNNLFPHQLHSHYSTPAANDQCGATDQSHHPQSQSPFLNDCYTMGNPTMNLEAVDERMVPSSMQRTPSWSSYLQPSTQQKLYHPPWNQLPDAHAPTMGDYSSVQFSAQTGVSVEASDIYSAAFF